jgi:hypothetical protein
VTSHEAATGIFGRAVVFRSGCRDETRSAGNFLVNATRNG